jgi:hypothetical protein
MKCPDNEGTDTHLHGADNCIGIVVLDRCLNEERFYVGLKTFLDHGQCVSEGEILNALKQTSNNEVMRHHSLGRGSLDMSVRIS